jgi:hypothetical protein
MDPTLIIFAIESAIRIGRKLNDILIDETVERPLVLPVGRLYADIPALDARDFFDLEENRHLVEEGGPYFDFNRDELVAAYRSLSAIDDRLGGSGGTLVEAKALVAGLHGFEQYKKGFEANPPAQRVLGILVEIGIDYFSANADALGKDSSSRRVLESFILRLDDIEFSEGTPTEIIGDVLLAALKTLDQQVSLVDDDKRLQVLLGGVTKAVIEEVEKASGEAEKIRREALIRRVGSSILRGGIGAFTENSGLFLPHDSTAGVLVQSTLEQVLVGIRDRDDLFTNESIELVFKAALRVVGENSQLFSDEKILQELISSTMEVLSSREGKEVFSEETVSAILKEALDVTAENIETLIKSDHPRKQLLAATLGAIAQGLSAQLTGNGSVQALLSKSQLVELTSIALQEVARHPEKLLGDDLGEARKTALAQIIGSVAGALGDDPVRLVNGASFLELLRDTLKVGVQNADKLLDLDTEDPKVNLLYRITQEIASAVVVAEDSRDLLSRDVFVGIVRRVLPVASANLGPVIETGDRIIGRTVTLVLNLAQGVLENRINGANLPYLVGGLLIQVLWEELALEDEAAVVNAANTILRAA